MASLFFLLVLYALCGLTFPFFASAGGLFSSPQIKSFLLTSILPRHPYKLLEQ
jgi:hypothetical protein